MYTEQGVPVSADGVAIIKVGSSVEDVAVITSYSIHYTKLYELYAKLAKLHNHSDRIVDPLASLATAKLIHIRNNFV